jgi:5-methylcytosine-specific restriction protein A
VASPPRRRCTEPGCSAPAERGGKCTTHRRNTTRWQGGQANRAFYRSPQWRALSAWVLDEQRICPGWPKGTHCGARTTDADHITPLEQGGAPLDRANVHALCHSCHARKTAHETGLGHRETNDREGVSRQPERAPRNPFG